jgi:hypothetical protein
LVAHYFVNNPILRGEFDPIESLILIQKAGHDISFFRGPKNVHAPALPYLVRRPRLKSRIRIGIRHIKNFNLMWRRYMNAQKARLIFSRGKIA